MCIVKFWKRNHLFPTTIYLYILKTIFILLLCWLVRLHSAASSSSIYVADFYVRGFGGVEEFYKKTIKILMNTKPLIRNQMMNHYSVRKPIKLCFVPVTFLRCVCMCLFRLLNMKENSITEQMMKSFEVWRIIIQHWILFR